MTGALYPVTHSPELRGTTFHSVEDDGHSGKGLSALTKVLVQTTEIHNTLLSLRPVSVGASLSS